jgi:hypothetical protein
MIGQYVDDLITECQIDNKMIISLPAYSPNINLKLNMIYILNDTLGIEGKSQIDSIKINYIDKNNNNELIAIATNYRYYHIVDSHNVWDSIYYSIIYSTDMGVSWQEKGRLNIPYPNHQLKVFIKKNNHIYIADQYYNKDSKESKAIIYSLNLETLLVDSLYSLNNFSIAYSPIFSISGNRAFLNGYDNNPDKKYYDIIINDDIENHPYNWKRIGPINRFNNVGIDAKNDSLITIYA